MASLFPPFLASAKKDPAVVNMTPGGSETFGPHSLVYYDTSSNTVLICGADPALIAGIALGSAASRTIDAAGKIPILILDPDTLIGMSSTTTPAESHVGDVYGIAKDATTGYWQVDTGDTSNTRLVVLKVDITNGIFYCRFTAANLQFDAIAS